MHFAFGRQSGCFALKCTFTNSSILKGLVVGISLTHYRLSAQHMTCLLTISMTVGADILGRQGGL